MRFEVRENEAMSIEYSSGPIMAGPANEALCVAQLFREWFRRYLSHQASTVRIAGNRLGRCSPMG